MLKINYEMAIEVEVPHFHLCHQRNESSLSWLEIKDWHKRRLMEIIIRKFDSLVIFLLGNGGFCYNDLSNL